MKIADFLQPKLDAVHNLAQQRFKRKAQLRFDQYGAGHKLYHDLTECVAALQQTRSDHERELRGVSSGAAGENLQ